MPTAFCGNHPDLEAVARCKGCRKLLCNKCRQRGSDGWYCSDTCLKKQASQTATLNANDANAKRGFPIGAWIRNIVILAAIGGAGYYVVAVIGIDKIREMLPF